MEIKKPEPLYNREGRVVDPNIAREMADEEELLRQNPEEIIDKHKKGNKQESINSQVEELGKMLQSTKEGDYERMVTQATRSREILDGITGKIANVLTPEERDVFKKAHEKIAKGLKK